MESQSVPEFVKCWRGFRGRTRQTLAAFPRDAGAWRPAEGAFCAADLARHLGRAESRDLGGALAELDALHEESCAMLEDLGAREGEEVLIGVDPPPIFGQKAEAVGEALLRERAGGGDG